MHGQDFGKFQSVYVWVKVKVIVIKSEKGKLRSVLLTMNFQTLAKGKLCTLFVSKGRFTPTVLGHLETVKGCIHKAFRKKGTTQLNPLMIFHLSPL